MRKYRPALISLLFIVLGTLLITCKPETREGLNSSQNQPSVSDTDIPEINRDTLDTVKSVTDSINKNDSIQTSVKNDSILRTNEEIKEKKYLYITFDDGPNEGTDFVIRTLRKHKTPTTLFFIGRNVQNSKTKVRELEQDSLFQIANHSYNHAWGRYKRYYSHPQGVLDDFNRAKEVMPYATISRTPGRNMWRVGDIRITDIKPSAGAANLLAQNGYQLVGWDLEWKYSKTEGVHQTAKEMMSEIDYFFNKKISRTKNHVILLAHDQYFTTDFAKRELEDFLKTLHKRVDIELRKINDYPAVTPDKTPFHPDELITMTEN